MDIDLVLQFLKITTATVLAQAKRIWNAPDASILSHTRGSNTYNARLLGVSLMNSLTPDFAAILHSRIDPLYCSNGPLLLHTMCQHIHHNHLTFIKTIKNKNSTIPVFQQSVLKWQRDYLENQLPLTPSSLALKANQECQILTHAGQWVETIDPSIIAMLALLHHNKTKTGEIFQNLAANFSQITHRQKEVTRSLRQPNHSGSSSQTPEWLMEAPSDPEQLKLFDGRYWHYCSKCGKNGR
jgi:hypothetical protein